VVDPLRKSRENATHPEQRQCPFEGFAFHLTPPRAASLPFERFQRAKRLTACDIFYAYCQKPGRCPPERQRFSG
jgi:hypothetical protein